MQTSGQGNVFDEFTAYSIHQAKVQCVLAAKHHALSICDHARTIDGSWSSIAIDERRQERRVHRLCPECRTLERSGHGRQVGIAGGRPLHPNFRHVRFRTRVGIERDNPVTGGGDNPLFQGPCLADPTGWSRSSGNHRRTSLRGHLHGSIRRLIVNDDHLDDRWCRGERSEQRPDS